MENVWLTYAKQLQAIAGSGLHFTESAYDQERYEEVPRIANEMLSITVDTPIQRIKDLVSNFAKGYATPRVDVRAAVIEDGKISPRRGCFPRISRPRSFELDQQKRRLSLIDGVSQSKAHNNRLVWMALRATEQPWL